MKIWEVLLDSDTIFKPFRIVALLIIIVGVGYQFNRWQFFPDKTNILIFVVYLIGCLQTILRYLMGFDVSLGGFISDALQITLNIMFFLTAKRLKLTEKELYNVLLVFIIGVSCNNWLVIKDYFITSVSSRTDGLLDSANWASFTNSCAIYFFIYKIGQVKNKLLNWRFWWYILLIIFMLMGLVATGSRIGLLIFGTFVPLMLLLSTSLYDKLRTIFYIALLIPILMLYTPIRNFASVTLLNTIVDNAAVNRMAGVSDDIRVYLWMSGWESIKDNYGTGLGIGQYRTLKNYKKYMLQIRPEYYYGRAALTASGINLHSTYVQLAVDWGLIPLILFLTFYVLVLRMRIEYYFKAADRNWALVLLLMCLSLFITNITSFSMLSGGFWMVLYIVSYRISDVPDDEKTPKLTGIQQV